MQVNSNFKDLEETLKYQFQNPQLLIQALTHKSYAHEHQRENNERFEFLGDAILQFVTSDYLMSRYPEHSEGMLSKFRAVLVSEKGLSVVAKKIDLGRFLLIGKGEEVTGGREKSSILSDALEAILASIFLDSKETHGVTKIAEIIHKLFDPEISNAEKTFATIDYKTDLQEFVQKNKLGELKYKIIEELGPDHDKEFVTALTINDQVFGVGRGKSKKISEQNAAIASFKQLKKENEN
ncbi:MAG: ribonuclease III [SAR324 cluster bacterium]|uniref:Ribonuclease 3 n=1 Tax=SAR324 cluster bacterium TaxID=2024889 RepID=A0A2A4SRF3_9DELT|nr:MAG: ribonuclease III [SAR324 cluster bacterium]